MLKVTIVMFVSLIFYKNFWAKNLLFLELDTLRNQHQFKQSTRGETELMINSSQRFLQLYDALEGDSISNINQEVDQAFNKPYKSSVRLNQRLIWKEYQFHITSQNSLVAEVNNPVFP